jgi:hypothetical protein
MWLILGPRPDRLCGADDRTIGILRHDERALAARHAGGNVAPEFHRFSQRHWPHEADRCAALDTVDQHIT